MDSRNNGREQVLQNFGALYDQMVRSISNNPNDEDHVQIDREELNLLREHAAQRTTIAEHNSRLQDELESCRAASARVEGLEKENQRLAGELEHALQQRAPFPFPPVENRSSFMTPGPNSEPSSSARNEHNTPDAEILAKYRRLVPKYNALSANFVSMKEAKLQLESIREADKLKLRGWYVRDGEQAKKIKRKDERIKRQAEEIQRLQSRLSAFTGEAEAPLAPELDLALSFDSKDGQVPETTPGVPLIAGDHQDAQEMDEGDDLLPTHRNNLDFHTTVQGAGLEDTEHRHSSSTNSDPIAEAQPGTKDVAIKQELSSSPLVVVSARTLRKTRKDTNTQPRKVKNEDLGSSSPLSLALHTFQFQDSIDLDDIGEKVDTPRKRKLALELSRRNSALTSSSPISSPSRSQGRDHSGLTEAIELPTYTRPATRKISALQPRSVNTPILPRTSDNRVYKKRKIADDQAVRSVLEDGEFDSLDNTTENHNLGRLDTLLNSPSPKKQAITPIRPVSSVQHVRTARTHAPSRLANEVGRDISPVKAYIAPCVPSSRLDRRGTSTSTQSKSPIKASAHSGRPVSRGTPHVSPMPERPTSRGKTNSSREPSPFFDGVSKAAKDRSRLHVMRDMPTSKERLSTSREPSPFFDALSTTGKDSARLRPNSRGRMEVSTTSREQSPFSDGAPIAAKNSPRLTGFFNKKPVITTPLGKPSHGNVKATPGTLRSAPPSRKRHFRLDRDDSEELDVQPEHEPLRNRPVQSLTMGDFKINPNYNQGYDYAFTEVVRGKDARSCIQGCVKPECCGNKIRAFISSMRDPNKPLTAAEEEEDTKILEEFMGGNVYKIQNMSKEERDEMVLQAKTRDYANKHGKHRHAFEKPSSPPGFWRADWPSTQEEIVDRAKAREKERNMVEERYREAMSKGGRFLFRDE